MAILEAITKETGRKYALAGIKTILGRKSDCDITLDSEMVSRRHAQILMLGDEYLLEDLGSRNGTFLNGNRVEARMPLQDRDLIQLSDFHFSFHNEKPVKDESAENLGSTQNTGCKTLFVEDPTGRPMGICETLHVTAVPELNDSRVTTEAKLSALLSISRCLGKATSLSTVLPQLLDGLFRIFPLADRGIIVLIDEQGQLVPKWSKFSYPESTGVIRISRTIVKKVIDSRDAVISLDAASDSRFDENESIFCSQIRSVMCAPLLNSEGTAFGAIQVDVLNPKQKFRAEDLEIFAAVASQAGIAIDNATLHEKALRQQAVEKDLELASQVQQSILPANIPTLGGYGFYSVYQPADKIGGDYYDYIELPDGRLAVIVADAVGHGIAAALLMVKLSAHARVCLMGEANAARAISRLNADFMEKIDEDRFVTLVVAVINPFTHELTVVNGGHMAPMLRGADGQVKKIGEKCVGLPLGVINGFSYEQMTLPIAASDLIVMYTDGVNETQDSDNQFYGIEAIAARLSTTQGGAETFVRSLLEDLDRFRNGLPRTDDICVVCFERAH